MTLWDGACIVHEKFSLENGCLTGTGRIKREEIFKIYQEKIIS